MIYNLYVTGQEVNGNTVHEAAPQDVSSTPITLDTPYITMPANRLVASNKMQIVSHIIRNLRAQEVGERLHTSIVKSLMIPLGASDALCYTYVRNVRAQLNGGDPYASNKKWNRASRASKAANQTESVSGDVIVNDVVDVEIPAAAPVAEVVAETLNRWQVKDEDTKTIVDSFTTRDAAQQFNKKLRESGRNTRWIDGSKVA